MGQPAHKVSMGRLLAQLFEITALFDMRLRPELVLLQKTMVTVEGVARRIDPEHDIWAAARPVVQRWIARELSAPAKLQTLAKDAMFAMRGFARLAEGVEHLTHPRAERRRASAESVWSLMISICALAAAAFAVGASLHH
jgi:ubiquinone biosynthesis protein